MSRRQPRHSPGTAPPSGREILQALAGYLAERWEQFLAEYRQVLRQPHPEAIHDLRVASRRLRAVLDHLAPFREAKAAAGVARQVRRLTRRLGGLRNLDEAREYFAGLGLSGLQPLCDRLQRRRERQATGLRHWLAKLEVQRLERKVVAATRALADGTAASPRQLLALLAERSLHLYLPISDMLPRAMLPEHGDDRHALRIAVKKWRYFNELLGRVTGSDTAALLEQLRSYQTVLGLLNDLSVFEEICTAELPAEELRGVVRQRMVRQREELDTEFARLIAQQPLHFTLTF